VRLTAYAAVALVGATLGMLLLARQDARIGPVEARLSLHPSLHGGTTIVVPPLGTIALDTHRGPLPLTASVLELRPEVAQQVAHDPTSLSRLGDSVQADLRSALVALAVRAVVGALLGAAALSLLAFRSLRRTAICLGLCTGALLASGGVAAATWRPDSIREPRFTGLLSSAPVAIGQAEQIVENFSRYRLALGQLVGNVVQLYDVTSSLPTYRPGSTTVAVLHISDLHLNPAGVDLVVSLARQYHVRAVLDTGDLTDHGSPTEAPFVAQLARLHVPYVYVRGNHDSATTVAEIRHLPGTTVLDGDVASVAGMRVAGIADPRFTPDKTVDQSGGEDELRAAGRQLAEVIAAASPKPDIALVHEPTMADELFGQVPLVLAGHTHKRQTKVKDGTLLLVGGSTGGAGLRGLEGDQPTPLECSILYFDAETRRLQAWDEVTLGGLGRTSVTVERHLRPTKAAPLPAPAGSPTLGPRPSPTPRPEPSPAPAEQPSG
jgi:predicted MPP superfamily phosphohydrolase